jgi:hypothetical protein
MKERIQKSIGTPALAVFCAGLLSTSNWCCAAEVQEQQPSPVEQFKAFIESPPVIKNLVFQQKVPMSGGARPLDGSFALSTRFDYFQARWQPDALFFRRLGGPQDETNFTAFGQLVALADHVHWLLEGQRVTTWDDRDPSVKGKTTSIFFTSRFFLQPLEQVMNMGVMHAGIGAIHWQGNSFHLETDLGTDHFTVNGELVEPASEPPERMYVHYVFQGKTSDYVVRYRYGGTHNIAFVPSVVTSYWISNGKEIELDEWKILSLETEPTPLPIESFDPAHCLEAIPTPLRLYTNGAFYARATDGSLELLERFGVQANRRGPPHWALSGGFRGVFYASWGMANLAIFAFMAKANAGNKQQLKEERENSGYYETQT